MPWGPYTEEPEVEDYGDPPEGPWVDWEPPEAIGIIELPDGEEIEVFAERIVFGFAGGRRMGP